MPLPTKRTIAVTTLFIFLIFLLGGGIDVIHTFTSGEQNAALIEKPKMSGLSPVAMMLYAFGFLSVMLIYWGGTNLKEHEKLAQKQIMAGIIILMVVFTLLTLVFGVGNDNWKNYFILVDA